MQKIYSPAFEPRLAGIWFAINGNAVSLATIWSTTKPDKKNTLKTNLSVLFTLRGT